jgi:predicted lipoprotein with Yx(FWY)xxD motif
MKKSYIVGIVVVIVAAVIAVAWIAIYLNQSSVAPYVAPVNVNTAVNQNANIPANIPANTPPANTPAVNAPAPVGPVTLNVVNDITLGARLVAPNGHALYYFTKDSSGSSTCAGVCATNWPAYIVSANSSLVGGIGVTGTIATIPKADGSRQVTYNGMPLYFWHTDVNPGDTYGHGVGGVWFVAKP